VGDGVEFGFHTFDHPKAITVCGYRLTVKNRLKNREPVTVDRYDNP
jgi:hypothetical protein